MVLLLFFYLILFLVAAAWVWLLLGLLKSGKRWTIGALALQISLIMAVIVVALGGGWAGVIGFVLPLPTAIPVTHTLLLHYPFYADFYYIALAAGVFVALLLSIFRPFRIWSPLIVVAVAIAMALPIAEKHSRSLMCQKALDLGSEEVTRNSFLWSLRHVRTNYMGELHAHTLIDGTHYAWSYRLLDWYRVDPLHFRHPSQIKTACGKA